MSDQMQPGSPTTGGPVSRSAESGQGRSRWLPTTTLGWWGVGLAVALVLVLLAGMIVQLPVLGGDSWTSVVALAVLVDLVAIVNVVAYVRARERAVLALGVLVLSVAGGLFFTLSVVVGGITGK